MTTARRIRLGTLALLAAGHLLVSGFAVVPGYLSIDEATYHLMAKYQSEGGGFEVWNGYDELPSPELVSSSTVVHDGRLAGRPPVLHTVLAVPFYRLAGYRGLFALNALAFAVAVGLTVLLARRLLGDLDLALDAALILVLAGFAWEYSQAAWTHATALAFTLGAFSLGVAALFEARPRRGAGLALAAGLIAGLGVGIRLDAVFLLATLLLLFVFRVPWQPGRALAALAGAAPALLALATINHRRFGIFSPISMGKNVGLAEIARYLPLLALAAVALAVAWAITRPPVWRRLRRRRGKPWVAVGLLAVALAVPASRRLVIAEARGAYTLGVDLRALDLERREPAMLRSDNRAVLYVGGVKKALLQSCPYLVLLLLPTLALARRRAADPRVAGSEAARLAVLFAPGVAYFAFYAQFSWHGGLSLNLRYLLPILPYTSILTAWALRRPEVGRGGWRAARVGAAVALLLFFACRAAVDGTAGDELLVQSLPMALAGFLLVALLLALRRRPAVGTEAPAGGPPVVAALAAAGLVWAGLTAFAYDLPLARETRRFNFETGERARRLVEPDSLFFADFVDPFFRLIEDRVRIARPGLDRYQDMPRLAAHHLAAGRAVYGAFDPRVWEILGRGPLTGFAVEPLWHAERFTLARIEPGSPAAGGGDSHRDPAPR